MSDPKRKPVLPSGESDLSIPENVPMGIFWMFITGLLFVGVTAIVRYLGSTLPAIEAAFIRYALGLLLLLPAMAAVLRRPPRSKDLQIFAWRGLAHGIGVMLWFYAMMHIPIAEVTAIGYTAPIFVTIGAALFLGERLKLRRVVAIVVGLVGALVILRPGFHQLLFGQFAQLIAAPMFAASFIIAKKLTGRYDTSTIVAMLSLSCTVVLLPGAWYQWQTPTWQETGLLALTAIIATAGHYTMVQAFRYAPITVTQPITILQLVWATLLGVFLFDEGLDPFVLVGGGIIVASASYITHREAQIARKAIPLAEKSN